MASVDISEQYREAGALSRHYSTARIAVISFLIPLCFGLNGLVVSKPEDWIFKVYLLIVEAIVFCTVIVTSILFSTLGKRARDWMSQAEIGRAEGLFLTNYMSRTSPGKRIQIDQYDRILIAVGTILHVAFYFYVLISAVLWQS